MRVQVQVQVRVRALVAPLTTTQKVALLQVLALVEELEARPDCDFGVSIDTDAYFRTSERLEGLIDYYRLRTEKLILFSQEYPDGCLLDPGRVSGTGSPGELYFFLYM